MNAKANAKARQPQVRLCVSCGARGKIAEGVLSYRHTPSGERVLCKPCWESLHNEWLRACKEGEEIPFDCYVDNRVGDARVIYGARNHESI